MFDIYSDQRLISWFMYNNIHFSLMYYVYQQTWISKLSSVIAILNNLELKGIRFLNIE